MPLTHYKCKPMLPVANRPVVDYAVSRLLAAGLNDITFALGYRPYDVVSFAEGYTDIRAGYSVEDSPLGTAGAVKAAAAGYEGDIVVCSGDVLSDSDIAELVMAHTSSRAMVTIETTEVTDLAQYGEVVSDGGRVLDVREKLPSAKGRRGIANAGTYVISSRALDYIPSGVPFDFARDLFPYLLRLGKRICEKRSRGYWRDIGSLHDFYAANFDMMGRNTFPEARHISLRRGRADNGSLVADGARICGGIEHCIIGEGAVISRSARLESCIVLPGEVVEESRCGCVIGRDFTIDPLLGGVNLDNTDNSSNIFHLFASINL